MSDQKDGSKAESFVTMRASFHSSPHTENAVSVTLSFIFYDIIQRARRIFPGSRMTKERRPGITCVSMETNMAKNAGKSQEHSRDEREWKKRATGVTHREPARKSRVMEIHRADIYPETLSLLPIAQCHRCHIQYCQYPPIHRGNFTSFKCNIL